MNPNTPAGRAIALPDPTFSTPRAREESNTLNRTILNTLERQTSDQERLDILREAKVFIRQVTGHLEQGALEDSDEEMGLGSSHEESDDEAAGRGRQAGILVQTIKLGGDIWGHNAIQQFSDRLDHILATTGLTSERGGDVVVSLVTRQRVRDTLFGRMLKNARTVVQELARAGPDITTAQGIRTAQFDENTPNDLMSMTDKFFTIKMGEVAPVYGVIVGHLARVDFCTMYEKLKEKLESRRASRTKDYIVAWGRANGHGGRGVVVMSIVQHWFAAGFKIEKDDINRTIRDSRLIVEFVKAYGRGAVILFGKGKSAHNRIVGSEGLIPDFVDKVQTADEENILGTCLELATRKIITPMEAGQEFCLADGGRKRGLYELLESYCLTAEAQAEGEGAEGEGAEGEGYEMSGDEGDGAAIGA